MDRSSLSIVFSVLVIIVITSSITCNIILGSNTITTAYAQDNNIINDNKNPSAGGQRVSFLTDDKVQIVGTYYAPQTTTLPPSANANAVILLHMLGHNRSDWNDFASTLSNKTNGYAVLSIDLRGHGDSITSQNGNTISFQSFTPEQQNNFLYHRRISIQTILQ